MTAWIEQHSAVLQIIASFATLLVVAIIVTVASYAFALPTAIYGWAKMGILSGALDAESMMDSFKDPIYILLNMIGTLAQFVLNIITLVAGAFLYFNLKEKISAALSSASKT